MRPPPFIQFQEVRWRGHRVHGGRTDGAAAAGGEANDFLFLLFQAERASGGGLLFSPLSHSISFCGDPPPMEVGAWRAAASDPTAAAEQKTPGYLIGGVVRR